MEPPPRGRAGWWALGLVVGAVLVYVLWSFVGAFVAGLFLYYATRPIFRRLSGRLGSRSLAAAVAIVGLTLPALALVGYALAISLSALGDFLARRDLAAIETALRPYIDASAFVRTPEELLTANGLSTLLDLLRSAAGYLGTAASVGVTLFVALAVAFYLLRDDRRLAAWIRDRFGDDGGVLVAYGRAVDEDLGNVFFGNILNALLTATIGAIVYSLLDFAAPAGAGVPYAAMLGLLAGVGSLIPVVGMKIVYAPVGVFLFARPFALDPGSPLWVPVAFLALSAVVVDLIPDFFLRPYVAGRNLHVGMVMLSYVLGSVLFGWYGLLLGPFLLVVGFHFARIVLPELVAGDAIAPGTVGIADGATVADETGTPAGPDVDPDPDGDTTPATGAADAPAEADDSTDTDGTDGPSPAGDDPRGSPGAAE
jgi:predicted PurR-regulated permease PerM